MGISTQDSETIDLEIYKTSETCKNILKEKEFVINFTDDISLFYTSVFEKKKLDYERAKKVNAPILKDANALLEMRVRGIEDLEEKVKVKAEIVDFYFNENFNEKKEKVNLINRAESLALECLVKATKIPHVSKNGKEKLKKEIRYISLVVRRVAPGSEAESLVEKVHSLFQ